MDVEGVGFCISQNSADGDTKVANGIAPVPVSYASLCQYVT